MDSAAESSAIPEDELTAVVRRALDAPDAALAGWQATPLVHRVINGVTAGLARVAGGAIVAGAPRSWSVILKTLRETNDEGVTPFAPSADPHHWNYWRREPTLYTSGLLDGFPAGLTVPRCLGVSEPVAGVIWLWLEDIAGEPAAAWSLGQYGRATRQLGRWQGRYAAGMRPLPATPWLSEGWLRAWVPDERGARLELVRDPAAWRHPLLREIAPAGLATQVDALWRDRDALLAAIEQTPLTFCHRDLWTTNLLARPDARGEEEIVLIDWSQSGNGALADDAANLAFDSVWMQLVDYDLPTFARLILDEYCLGLRDSGWYGDEGTVRATYAAIAALRFGLLADGSVLAFAHDETQHAAWATRYRRPIAEVIGRRGAVVAHALALAGQGRALLRR